MNIEQIIQSKVDEAYPSEKWSQYHRDTYIRGLREMHEQYQSNPSEFGMVKKEDYDRQVHLVNHYRKLAYKDSKLNISEQDEEAMKNMKLVQSGSKQRQADQLAEALKFIRRKAVQKLEVKKDGLLEVIQHKAELALENYYTALTNYEQGKGDDGWISVEEELPEEHSDVLVYYYGNKDSKYFPDCQYMKQSSYYNGRFEAENVTHWRPLPAPPTNYENNKTK